MPDSTPNVNETALAEQLALELAVAYLAPSPASLVVAQSIAGIIQQWNANNGRPPGWKPGPNDWKNLADEQLDKTADKMRERDHLPSLPAEDDVPEMPPPT